MIMNFNLSGKVAVITGGGGVLGSVIAKELGKQGVKVAVLGHSGTKAQEVADEIVKNGGIAIANNVDVLNKENLKEVRDFVVEKFGTVDILINGAGGNKKEAT